MDLLTIYFYAPPGSSSFDLNKDGKHPLLTAIERACHDMQMRPVGYVGQGSYHQLHRLDKLPARLHVNGFVDLEFINPRTGTLGPRMCLGWHPPEKQGRLTSQSCFGSCSFSAIDLAERCTSLELAQYLVKFGLYAVPSDGFCWVDTDIIQQLLEEHFAWDDFKAVGWLTVLGNAFYQSLPESTRDIFAQSAIPFLPLPEHNPSHWYILFPEDCDPLNGPPLDDCSEIRLSVCLEGISIRGFLTEPMPPIRTVQ